MFEQTSIAAIILAAGKSSRMAAQQHKLLLPLNGHPILAHVLEAVQASQARPGVLVLGHQADRVQATIQPYLARPDMMVCVAQDYAEGMSSSLRTGIQTLLQLEQNPGQGRIEGALIILGDQPLITASLLNQLIELKYTSGKRIVAPLFEDRRGNPVIFDRQLFPALLTVSGDEGGRSILKQHPDEIATLTVRDQQINQDIDTWEAYQQMLGQKEA